MQAKLRMCVVSVVCYGLFIFISQPTSWAIPRLEDLLDQNGQLHIFLNKSQVLKLDQPAERVSVVSADVADVQILEPKQILISAKSVGETSLIVWTEDGKSKTLDVVVSWNTEQIARVLNVVMPDEAIEVLPLDDGVALQGTVSRVDAADQAVELAKSFVPNVINLLTVPGIQQVMLKVKVAEVARSYGKDLGIDFRKLDSNVQGGSLLGDLISGNVDSNPINLSEAVTLFFGFPNSNFDIFLRAMKQKGLLYIMAEPNLIARSGETATFLAGGEFPVPVVQSGLSNTITIEWKEFGVRLNFTPTVLSQSTIQMQITPEVSDLDFSRGVTIGGFVVPVITTRRASTVVKLDDGQTFAIAGLIDQKKQKTEKRIPVMGDIPMLGNLFRSKELSETETELLIMVTPHLIGPIEKGKKFILPTDDVSQNSATFMDMPIGMNETQKKALNKEKDHSTIQAEAIEEIQISKVELPEPVMVEIPKATSKEVLSQSHTLHPQQSFEVTVEETDSSILWTPGLSNENWIPSPDQSIEPGSENQVPPPKNDEPPVAYKPQKSKAILNESSVMQDMMIKKGIY